MGTPGKLFGRLRLGTIGSKIAALFALVIGSISIFIFWFFPARIAIQAESALQGKAESIAAIASFSVRSAVVFDDRESMLETLRAAMQTDDVLYVAVSDTLGQILTMLSAEGSGAAQQVGDEVVSLGLLRHTEPVVFGDQRLGDVHLGVSLRYLRSEVHRARIIAAVVSAVVFIFGMVAIYTFSRLLTVPLTRMVKTAEKIAEGDLSERAEVATNDEIGTLASTFNVMVGRLHSTAEKLEMANKNLENRVEARTRDLKLESDVRRKVEEELRQSQKMDAVGRLAAGVAHDFNNLLTVINGHSSLLLEGMEEDDRRHGSVERIMTAGESAATLTRQLLAFSRKQVLKPKVVDLNKVVKDVTKMLDRLLGEDIEVVPALSNEIGLVKADPGQVEQVMMNLAVNARDAMPDGGKLFLRTKDVEIDEAFASDHPGAAPGPHVVLTVADTGTGIAQEMLDKIFEPFFTTKKSGRGTGLGLSTVYGIIKQSDGYITVESKVGRGTAFMIYLPHTQEREARPSRQMHAVSPETGSETVLLVEDSAPVREVASRILREAGYRVFEADGGTAAVGICNDYSDDIHLLLTDVVMPGMNGSEVAKRVLEMHPEAALLYMTGYTDDAVVLRGVLEVGVELIEKPFTSAGLLARVREALDQMPVPST